MSARRAITLGAVVLFGSAGALRAQGGYEIEVYSAEIAPLRSLLLELHSNYTFRGRDKSTAAGSTPLDAGEWIAGGFGAVPSMSSAAQCTHIVLPFFQVGASSHVSMKLADLTGTPCVAPPTGTYATHETIEAVTGLTSWSEIGAYLMTSEQIGPLVRAIGGAVRYKARIPGTWNWPANVALSTELEYDDPRYSTDTWTWEIRPVVDRSFGRWYVSVNPTVERTLEGAGTVSGMQFSPSAKGSFDFTEKLTGGVEYYAAYGKIGGFAPGASRIQQIFGAVDLHVSPAWEVNAGLGVGATPGTSRLVGKLIVGRRM
jgi:hypothetical protein